MIKLTKNLLLIIFSISILFSGIVLSQESMSPPAEILKLYSLEGKWEGNFKMEMEGNAVEGKASYIWSKIADGWGMLIDETIDLPGLGKYLGHNIIGYDVNEKRYHIYTVSNFAQVHDHPGNWKDENSMYFEYNGSVEGKPFIEKVSVIINGQDTHSFEITEITDGKITSTGKITVNRVK